MSLSKYLTFGEPLKDADLQELTEDWDFEFPLTHKWADAAGLMRVPSSVAADLLQMPDNGKLSAIVFPRFGLCGVERCRITLMFLFDDEQAFSTVEAWRKQE